MIPFTPTGLEKLKLTVELDFTGVEQLFLCLAHRTPALKKITIESEISPSQPFETFTDWIQTCTQIEEAYLPVLWHNSSVIRAFGSLPNLLEFGFPWKHLEIADDGDLGWLNGATEGQFSSLRRLAWSSSIGQAIKVLHHIPRRLQKLTLDCNDWSSHDELSKFFTALGHSFPELYGICLNLERNFRMEEGVSWEMVRTLLPFKGLTELRIHYWKSFVISVPEVEEMGVAWPAMRELVLCPDPSVAPKGGTSISSLPHFAKAFPYIRVLGLYLDSKGPTGFAGDLLSEKPFKCLRTLDVGTSPPPEEDPESWSDVQTFGVTSNWAASLAAEVDGEGLSG
ncbi:hypothetical protein FRB90_012573 [Tulasnella sp. 427]|nr:hypothetical protein FRB90_012573 [Tulasnella sp. 427]